jgi:hypothetical protein
MPSSLCVLFKTPSASDCNSIGFMDIERESTNDFGNHPKDENLRIRWEMRKSFTYFFDLAVSPPDWSLSNFWLHLDHKLRRVFRQSDLFIMLQNCHLLSNQLNRIFLCVCTWCYLLVDEWYKVKWDMIGLWLYEGRLKSSWAGDSAPPLCRVRWWLVCQVVVVGVT